MKTTKEIEAQIAELDAQLATERNPRTIDHLRGLRKIYQSALYYSTTAIDLARQTRRASFFLGGR
jgi:23S rRNA maturation-related 3'-5' exoribonuclease YhaM